MEVTSMGPLPDSIVNDLKDDCIWPVEVKIEPEDFSLEEDGEKCYQQDSLLLQHICSLCNFAGLSLSDLRRHIKYQHNQKQYKLQSYKFKPRKPFLDSEKNLLQCNDCIFKTRWKSRLAEHVLVHSAAKPYVCEYCSYRSASAGHLKKHLDRHLGIRPYACDKCGYSAQSSSDLKKHTRVHADVKPFVCEVCSYATTTSYYLKMHMSKHTGDRPFKCEHCSYRTARRGDLASHMLSHAKDKPYMCPCGFKTARPAHLKRHMSTHNSNRPFDCKKCKKKFNRLDDLRRHLKTHSTEKKHGCPYCEYRALAPATVRRHMYRMHPEERNNAINSNFLAYDIQLIQNDFAHNLLRTKSNVAEVPPTLEENNLLFPEIKEDFICFHCGFVSKHLKKLKRHVSYQHFRSKDKPG